VSEQDVTSAKEPPSVEPDDWFDLLDDAPPPAPQVPPSTDHSRKQTPVVTPSVPPDAFSPSAVDPAETWEWDPSPTPPPRPPPAFSRTLSFSADDVQALAAELRRPSAEVLDEPADALDEPAPPVAPESSPGAFIDFGWTPTPVPPRWSEDEAPAEAPAVDDEPLTASFFLDPPTQELPEPGMGFIADAVARGSRPPVHPTAPGIPSALAASRRPAPATMMFGGGEAARHPTPAVPVPEYHAPRPSTPIGMASDTIPPLSEPVPAAPSIPPSPQFPPSFSAMRAPTPVVNPIISAEARGAPLSPRPIPASPSHLDAMMVPTPVPAPAPVSVLSTVPPAQEESRRPLLRAPPRLPLRPGAHIPAPDAPKAPPKPAAPPSARGSLPPLPPPPSRNVPAPPPLPPRAQPFAAPKPPAPPDENSWASPPAEDVTPVVFPRRDDLAAAAASRRHHKVTPAVGMEIPQEAIPTPLVTSGATDFGGELSARREMRERLELNDFNGALGLAQSLTEIDPRDGEALRVAEQCRQRLRAIYVGRLGELTQVPTLTISRSELRWLTLDHRAGFVLSLIDGASSIEDIIDVSTMPTFEVLRTLYVLLSQNVISLRRPRR
jgi:hypothetical protein